MPSWSLDASTLTGLPSDDFLPSTSTVVEIFGLSLAGTLVDEEALVEEDSEAVEDGFSLEVDELVDVTREDDVVEDSEPDEVGTTGFGVELLAEVEDVADDEEEEEEDDGVSLSHFTLMPAVAFDGTFLPGLTVIMFWATSTSGFNNVPAGSLDVFCVDAEIFA